MKPIRNLLKYPLANRPGQYLLRKQVKFCQWLMGIGAGGEVTASGEVAMIRRLRRAGRRDVVVFDVGANQGQFLRLVLAELGPVLKELHSFEPAVATFQTLQRNTPQRDGVVLNNLGVAAKPGTAELYYDAENSGLASLTQRDLSFRGKEFARHETVTLTTLDAYCAEHRIERIDWLKLDIEGHELDALQGAAGLFTRRAIGVVTFEFGGCNVDTRTFLRDFHRFFTARQMRLCRITPGGYFAPVEPYRETTEQFSTTNFAAF
jgi:FkbM family methyltransferase